MSLLLGTVSSENFLATSKVRVVATGPITLTMTECRIFRALCQPEKKVSDDVSSGGNRVTFKSGVVDGTGVVGRVAGADGCKLERVTRKVPYLLLSALMSKAVLKPVED